MSNPDDWTDEYQPPSRLHSTTAALDERLRRRFWWNVAVLSVVLVVLGILAYRSWWTTPEPNPKLAAAVDVLRQQVEDLGEEPVAPPAEDITDIDTEIVPIPGRDGPEGKQGRPGRDAPPPSLAQVIEGLRSICGFCTGPIGATGADGATGDQGPGPSAEQVASGIDAYCASQPGGSCEGTAGADGADGINGADGPPVASFTFDAQGRTWTCTDPDGDLAYDCVADEPPPSEPLP